MIASAQRLGASWSDINQFGTIVVDGFRVSVEDALYLRFIPDGLFAALAFALALAELQPLPDALHFASAAARDKIEEIAG